MLRDMNPCLFIRMYNSIIPPANSSLRILRPPTRMYHDQSFLTRPRDTRDCPMLISYKEMHKNKPSSSALPPFATLEETKSEMEPVTTPDAMLP
jgi:hypothetical protein